MRFFALLGVAVLATGCARGPLRSDYQIVADPGFSPAYLEALTDAVDDWASHGAGLTVVVGACQGRVAGRICVHASDGATVGQRAGQGHLSVTDEPDGAVDGAEVWVAVDTVDSTADANAAAWLVRENFAHELGHAMGLQHHDGVGAVMASTALASSHGPVTEDDVAQWRSLR